ncbi:MAG: helix-turn-helix transcriptional regulator [Alphaproteobacteria bacterium]|nr:helix-turn-helix transcriptional regulator [Alphaproteobacteria bacterium]
MARSIDDYIKKLPKKRRDKIAKRAAELIAEEATLQELRKALHCSQEKVAEELGVNQAAVSKIERRTDMYVSTLRSYIEAMGGSLDIVAQFPGSPPVHISQFKELE